MSVWIPTLPKIAETAPESLSFPYLNEAVGYWVFTRNCTEYFASSSTSDDHSKLVCCLHPAATQLDHHQLLGCTYVVSSFQEYFLNHEKGIFMLVDVVDVYLLGTVMLAFSMGLYEIFISNLDIAQSTSDDMPTNNRSNLFGLFVLKERPKWLEINSVIALKTKLGHVIVMLLLIGLFETNKKATILTSTDLLCFSGCVLLSSGCLYLLSKLH